ncbi:MAG: AAA family ATPase [Chitinophagaceae bacterium]
MKKIVIIGPESTGKSTICKELAKHFDTLWCPEFAREYLMQHGTNYNYTDLLTIAKGQIELEDTYTKKCTEQNKNLLFIDTDMYVMKVWSEFVFSACHHFILDQIVARKYDLYLLCNTDLPWTKDELREYPDLETRNQLYCIYKDILVNQNTPWLEIKGVNRERTEHAIDMVSDWLKG